jgi:acyl carrier protein
MLTASKRALATGEAIDAFPATADEPGAIASDDVRNKVRSYILDSILLGTSDKLEDNASLLDAGILDSTGTMELVAYLENEFGLTVFDADIVADNLDSVDRICAFLQRTGKTTNR